VHLKDKDVDTLWESFNNACAKFGAKKYLGEPLLTPIPRSWGP